MSKKTHKIDFLNLIILDNDCNKTRLLVKVSLDISEQSVKTA